MLLKRSSGPEIKVVLVSLSSDKPVHWENYQLWKLRHEVYDGLCWHNSHTRAHIAQYFHMPVSSLHFSTPTSCHPDEDTHLPTSLPSSYQVVEHNVLHTIAGMV